MWKEVLGELKKLEKPSRAKFMLGFYRTGPGEYGEGDKFLGLTVPETRALAKKYSALDPRSLEKLLRHEWHEARLLALVILGENSKKAVRKKDSVKLAELFRFFVKNIKGVNNWDLVDVSAPWIVGPYLIDRNDSIRKKWLRSRSLWVRRISYVSFLYDARAGKLDRIYRDAPALLNDREDLMHKALGWVLREAGKKDAERLREFLKKFATRMPRTALRYSIERFGPGERARWLRCGKKV